MARQRSIKPEFWDDEKLASVSRDARYLYISLWKCSDDYGVTRGNASWLNNQVFPYDGLKATQVQKWLDELQKIKVIYPFLNNGEKYYYIKMFTKHQKIDKPSKTRNPECPASLLETLASDSLLSSDEVEVKLSVSEEKLSEVKSCPKGPALPDEFLAGLKTSPAYAHVNIDLELAKMDVWLSSPRNKNRTKTPRFVINWLNRIEAPLNPGVNTSGKTGIEQFLEEQRTKTPKGAA